MKRNALIRSSVLAAAVLASFGLAPANAVQDGTFAIKEGTYVFIDEISPEVNVFIEVRLTKATNGKSYSAEGIINQDSPAGKASYNLSGSMTLSGKLRAQYYKGTNKNDASPLDGIWDADQGELVLDGNIWTRQNSVRMKEAKTLSGDYTGGDWGKIKLQATLWGCQGSYFVSENDRGTFSMTKAKEGSGYAGTWTGQNNHAGTCESAQISTTMSVKWVCTGACKGSSGTSSWTKATAKPK